MDDEALYEKYDERVRKIAREEISSMAGLVLRRLQDQGPTRSFERNAAVDVLSEIFGEVLRDFSATKSEPGNA